MRRQRFEWLENVVCAIDLGGEYEEYYDDEGGECGDGDDFGGGDWHVPSARGGGDSHKCSARRIRYAEVWASTRVYGGPNRIAQTKRAHVAVNRAAEEAQQSEPRLSVECRVLMLEKRNLRWASDE